jgi:hypothetical protein
MDIPDRTDAGMRSALLDTIIEYPLRRGINPYA